MFEKIYWYLDGRILMADFGGTASLEDVKKASKLALMMLNNENQPPMTHVIANVINVSNLDASILKLHPMREAITPVLSNPHTGWFVLVDSEPDHVILFIIKTITELTSRRMRVVPTLQDALQFIDDIDPSITLPSDSP